MVDFSSARTLLCVGALSLGALAACGDDANQGGAGGGAGGAACDAPGAQCFDCAGNPIDGTCQGGVFSCPDLSCSSGGQGQGGQAQGGQAQGGQAQGGAASSAEQLLALTAGCTAISQGNYQSDDEPSAPANIPICALNGAVFWVADMDIDCDGKMSASCNLAADPAYQPETSATDSNGDPLDAASLPFVVIPLPSSRFDYAANNIQLGQVVAVIYNGQLRYGVFGDEGPSNIIGEASYAMATSLGVDPDPSTGGTDGPVTYIVFTGGAAVAQPIEDHAAATQLGSSLAQSLIDNN